MSKVSDFPPGDLFGRDDFFFIDVSHCVPAFKLDAMNPNFWSKVVDLSERVGGITINSAYRTVPYEYTRGRSGSSQHCKGLAVDIACFDSGLRWKLVSNAMVLGFHRILVYRTFIHIDDKLNEADRLVWMEK